MIKKYRKKPVVIEAIKWNGKNADEVFSFMGRKMTSFDDDMLSDWSQIIIYTLEGDMIASVGDYIIKGVDGEFYPCKPDIFEKTYEVVE